MSTVQGRAVGVDHVGFVVSDLDAAVAFLIEELGFADLHRRAEVRDDAGERMTRRFGVHPRSVVRYAFLGAGEDKVELLEWTAPDRQASEPRNSDPGGRHLAIAVDDVAAVSARLEQVEGVTLRELTEAGFRYVSTPFGLELQLIPAP